MIGDVTLVTEFCSALEYLFLNSPWSVCFSGERIGQRCMRLIGRRRLDVRFLKILKQAFLSGIVGFDLDDGEKLRNGCPRALLEF